MPQVPTTAWETFFLALSDGDAQGVWYALSWPCTKAGAPVVAASLLCKLITGEGLPGDLLGAVEGVSYLLVAAGLATQVYKFANEMNEHSNDGKF